MAGFKPKYCDATGNMVDNCKNCGCPADKPNCQSDGTCTTKSSKPSASEGKYQIYLEVMNKGSGEIDKIAPGNLNIYFEDMEVKSCSEEFKIINKNKVENIKPIIIRGQKPFKYYFSFDPSSSIKSELTKNENILTITKRITANADYVYRLSKEINILVSPRAEY